MRLKTNINARFAEIVIIERDSNGVKISPASLHGDSRPVGIVPSQMPHIIRGRRKYSNLIELQFFPKTAQLKTVKANRYEDHPQPLVFREAVCVSTCSCCFPPSGYSLETTSLLRATSPYFLKQSPRGPFFQPLFFEPFQPLEQYVLTPIFSVFQGEN